MTPATTTTRSSGERILRFDPHRSLGTLWVRPLDPDSPSGLSRLAEARFGVLVPAGMRLTLIVDPAAAALGLAPLADLPADALDGLVLLDCPVDDDDMGHVGGLSTLRLLDLYCTAITDAAMPIVGGFHDLEWLSLTSTWVSDEGLTHLADLCKLRRLSLKHTRVGSATSMEILAAFPDLIWLSLTGTGVADASLETLAGAPSLAVLSLAGTAVTEQGLAWWRDARPEVTLFDH